MVFSKDQKYFWEKCDFQQGFIRGKVKKALKTCLKINISGLGWPGLAPGPGVVPEAPGAAGVYDRSRLHFYFLAGLAGWLVFDFGGRFLDTFEKSVLPTAGRIISRRHAELKKFSLAKPIEFVLISPLVYRYFWKMATAVATTVAIFQKYL